MLILCSKISEDIFFFTQKEKGYVKYYPFFATKEEISCNSLINSGLIINQPVPKLQCRFDYFHQVGGGGALILQKQKKKHAYLPHRYKAAYAHNMGQTFKIAKS